MLTLGPLNLKTLFGKLISTLLTQRSIFNLPTYNLIVGPKNIYV